MKLVRTVLVLAGTVLWLASAAHGQMRSDGAATSRQFSRGGATVSSFSVIRHDVRFHRDFFPHRSFFVPRYRSSFVFIGGYPAYSYPAYPYAYCYSYPAYYPTYSYGATYSYYPSSSYSSSYASPPAKVDYWQLGHDWGQDLRQEVVGRDQFVDYVKAYIANARGSDRGEFRRGFITGYGVNAEAAFDKAMRQASEETSSESNEGPAVPQSSRQKY
jgi:hypothetical protein